MNKILIRAIIIIPFIFYFLIGIFVIQPIGALPEGATILYWRIDTNLPFITSPDGWLIDTDQKVSLLTRGIAMGSIGVIVIDRKIAILPYSKSIYQISTGGKEFVRNTN